MASRLWNFLTLDIGERAALKAADSGLHDADAVIGLAEMLAAEGANIQKLVPLMTQLDSLLDALNSPLREIEELDLSFVPIGKALLQLYKDQTAQEPTAAQKVALISQVAYLEAIKALLAEPQLEPWLTQIGDLPASNAVRQKIQRLKAIELGETEARKTLRSFQGSALAAAYSEVLIARFSELGIKPRQAGKIAVKLAHQAQTVMLSMLDSQSDRPQRSVKPSQPRTHHSSPPMGKPRSQPLASQPSPTAHQPPTPTTLPRDAQTAMASQPQPTATGQSAPTMTPDRPANSRRSPVSERMDLSTAANTDAASLVQLFEQPLSEVTQSSLSEIVESSEFETLDAELDPALFAILDDPEAAKVTESSLPETVEPSVSVESEPFPEVLEEPEPDATEPPLPESPDSALWPTSEQSLASEGAKPSPTTPIESSQPRQSNASTPAIAAASVPDTVAPPQTEVTEPLPSYVEAAESPLPEATKSHADANIEAPISEVKVPNVEVPSMSPSVLENVEQSRPEIIAATSPETSKMVEPSLSEEIDSFVLDFLDQPLPEVTEPSLPEVTEPSFPDLAQPSPSQTIAELAASLAAAQAASPAIVAEPSPPQMETIVDKKPSIETYLKEWIAPRPHAKMLGEAFSFKDIYIPLKSRLLKPTGNANANQIVPDLGKWVQAQLYDSTQSDQVMVVQGAPGRGKTLFCRLLADWMRRYEYPQWTPILIHLSSVAGLSGTFEETLVQAINADFARTGTDWLTDPTIKFLFVLDGADELPTADMRTELAQFWEQVSQFQAECARDPDKGHRVLVTARPLAVNAVANSMPQNLMGIEILPMDDALQQQWCDRWAALVEPQNRPLMEILRHPNLPDWVRESAREPLLLYLLAAIHRGEELQLEKLTHRENVQTEILLYDRILTWLLMQRRPEDRKHNPVQLAPANLRHILKEVGLCVMQSGRGLATIPAICDRLTQGSAASALTEAMRSHLTTDTLRLKNELATLYCQPSHLDAHALEFTFKRWSELLHIERMATGLVTLCQPEVEGAIDDPTFCWMLYDLLSSTVLNPPTVTYLMAMLVMSPKFAAERLQKRLYAFYWRWCHGEFIDVPAETLPQRTLRLLSQAIAEQPYPLGQRQIDAQMGLNTLILLLEFHHYGHSLAVSQANKKAEPENTLFFHPCSRPDYKKFEVQQLLQIISTSHCLGSDAFRERLRPFLYGVDLRNADLNHIDLCNINLKGANLHSADLNHANLREVNLSYANLRSANLDNATLRKADLRGAHLRSARLFSADLVDVNFSGANLSGADLRRTRLSGADLSGANMNQANLNSAELQGCRLCKTDLNTAILPQANLTDADLSHANLGNANLNGTLLSQAQLPGANLSRANLKGADLSGADLSGADLGGANLNETNLIGANLTGANLTGANLTGANFRKANLKEANLKGAHLSHTSFNDADLSEAILRGTNLSGTNFDGAILTDVNLSGLDLSHANLRSAKLNGSDLGRANLSGADLRNTELNEVSLIGANLFEANLFEADLSEADLHSADLFAAKLMSAKLNGTNLDSAHLTQTNCFEADLTDANLTQAELYEANLGNADLSGAILSGANLSGVNFFEANLAGANLSDAYLFKAVLSNTNLTNANLGGADFSGADCSNADLTEAVFFGKDGAIQWDDSTTWDDVDGLDTVIGLQEVLDQRLGTSSAAKRADSDLLF